MLGWQELILIFTLLLVVFGPNKLPELARDLGKAWNEFNKASRGGGETISSTQTEKNEDKNKLLVDVAKKLDLNFEGKTDDKLLEEVLTKIINNKESYN